MLAKGIICIGEVENVNDTKNFKSCVTVLITG